MSFYTIKAKAGAKNETDVFIYGDIGESFWGDTIAAKDFVKEISVIDADVLNVRINSYGGSVSDGIAIHNALKRHKATINVSIDGVAASIASLIAMAGDHISIAANAQIMVHAPWAGIAGNSVQLREFADYLDAWAGSMAKTYAAKTGRDESEMLAMLTDGEDHWFGADAALSEKLVDEITGAIQLNAHFDLKKRFSNVPADLAVTQPAASAVSPKEVISVTKPTETPEVTAQVTAADILAKDSTRRAEIKASFEKFTHIDGAQALATACQDDTTCTPESAGQKLLALLAKGAEPVSGGRIVTVEDERDKFRAQVSGGIMARAGLAKQDTQNPMRGYTLMEMARACAERAGARTSGMSKMEVVAAAFTHHTSDFSTLLADVANKAMLKGYEEAEETFQLWTSVGSASDFKPNKRVDLNTFPALSKVNEGAEYTYATIGERGETVQLATYGKMFSITRQAIINDDLSAFTRIPAKMGRAAIRTIGDLVYAVLTGNPVMADGVTLFHANHNNLPTGAVPSTAAVDAMRVAMAKQTDGVSTLNIRLAHLIVPVALEGLARTIAESEREVTSARTSTTPNYVRGTFDVISDARLDASSSIIWYGAANQAAHDTIEVTYLDGQTTPVLEQQGGWNIDGVDFKVRMDAGVKALDFRTLAKNAVV